MPHRPDVFWPGFYRTRDPNGAELVAVSGAGVVGHLGLLTNSAPRRKHVASFGIAVHPDHQGQGAGAALMGEMLNLADNWYNITRMQLDVASNNARAIALYRRFGFEVEGESRFDLFFGGRYQHTTHMVRFHPNFAADLA
ncbi:GCN5-related N-acetyltransferase [Ketogulonicigenium robustum]|uniref:GCN5-related N-acetyltransferase n=1 Tax=Ketogulonicigenium robustum TaxID=92947 RepID=A0A1W6P267_9RHOB|nr:GCN5-related N-acetyltransferase [Ketogulonicigenium robustum]